MKISRKITLTIVLTLLLLLGVGYVGLHYVVGNKFGELERMSVERNRERVRAVVQAELGQLTMLGQDWSEWDETYAYMVSRDPAYLAANLNVRSYSHLLGESDQTVFAAPVLLKQLSGKFFYFTIRRFQPCDQFFCLPALF